MTLRPKFAVLCPEMQKAVDRVLVRCVRKKKAGCWLWTGARGAGGYGRIKFQGRLALCHRLIAHAAGMPVQVFGKDREVCVLHSCDEPSCCNPRHLRVGTLSDNMRECADKGRLAIQARTRVTTKGRKWVLVAPQTVAGIGAVCPNGTKQDGAQNS